MKPMEISVAGAVAQVTYAPTLTCGRVGQEVVFTFAEGWENMEKTAVFRCGQVSLPVVCRENTAPIPWEVLERPGCTLYVGVYGTDGTKILPTVWAAAGKVEPGTALPEDTPKEPTADVYGQILHLAASVREDADKGKFTPKKGVDYYTAEEKEELVAQVLSALPVYEGQVQML